jgi:CHAD domain-containing protein
MAKPAELAFEGDTTLHRALDVILRAVLRDLRKMQPAAEAARDPEGIHQYRVTLRRLRSILGLVQPIAASSQLEIFQSDATWLMTELNDVRDWDVFITQTLPMIAQACPTVEGFDALAETAEKQRVRAHDRAHAAITDPRVTQFQLALGQWVQRQGWRDTATPFALALMAGPARDFAAEVLARLHRKARKRGRCFGKLAPEELHDLRITLKRLRYAADFFLPLLGQPKRKRRYAKSLAALQERLGRYNDMAVTQRLLETVLDHNEVGLNHSSFTNVIGSKGLERDASGKPLHSFPCSPLKSALPAAWHRAAGAVLGWQAGHLSCDYTELKASWIIFRKAKLPF